VVTVTATLDTGSSETIAARLVRIDASGHELEQLDQGTGPGHLELSGSSSVPGAETARYRVVITEPAGCGPQTQDFDVPTCDTCPHVDFGRPGLSDTCDDQGRRDVVMSVQLQGSPGQALDARLVHDHLGQASVRDHQTGAGTITLTDDEQLDPGEHTFRVEFTRPRGCPPQETHVAVPPCGGEPPNGGLRPQPIPCWVLELLGFIFFFAGIGMLIGGAAADLLPVALAGDALIIVGNVLLSIWAWACASCEALRRLGIAFGAAFLVLTIVGSILIGIGALNVGLGFLFAGLAFGGLALLFLFVFASKCGR
jgi:hypothetical protein